MLRVSLRVSAKGIYPPTRFGTKRLRVSLRSRAVFFAGGIYPPAPPRVLRTRCFASVKIARVPCVCASLFCL